MKTRLLFPACFFLLTASHADDLTVGLAVSEYPRTETQTGSGDYFIERENFGQPVGPEYLVDTLDGWEWDQERNATASGFLRIEKPGKYEFISDSFYDRNELRVSGELLCSYRDGTDRIATIDLTEGLVSIESSGYVGSRGKAVVKWRPPGQAEFSPIPRSLLAHKKREVPLVRRFELPRSNDKSLVVVAKDFVLEVYKNGVRVPEEKRHLLLDRFGATAERIDHDLVPGDWLVFHVANNRLRHDGSKFFSISAPHGKEKHGIVTNPDSANWSICDDPVRSRDFIQQREEGTESRAMPISHEWEEGMKYMREFAGDNFHGRPLWGAAPSTWIKYIVPENPELPVYVARSER